MVKIYTLHKIKYMFEFLIIVDFKIIIVIFYVSFFFFFLIWKFEYNATKPKINKKMTTITNSKYI